MIDKSVCLFLILILVLINFVRSDDEKDYGCAFTDVAVPCQDYDNKHASVNITLSTDSEHATLSGTITLDSEVGDTCEIYLDIWKKLDDGQEDPEFSAVGSICASILEDDAPWKPVFDSMGISSCPIAVQMLQLSIYILYLWLYHQCQLRLPELHPLDGRRYYEQGSYEIVNLQLNLGFADPVMSADFVAKYHVQMKIMCGLDDFSCFSVGVEVYEKEEK